MPGLEQSKNKTLFIEFVQFLTPKFVLPRGLCVVVSVQLSAQYVRVVPKLFINLWGKKKVWFKVFEFDI